MFPKGLYIRKMQVQTKGRYLDAAVLMSRRLDFLGSNEGFTAKWSSLGVIPVHDLLRSHLSPPRGLTLMQERGVAWCGLRSPFLSKTWGPASDAESLS